MSEFVNNQLNKISVEASRFEIIIASDVCHTKVIGLTQDTIHDIINWLFEKLPENSFSVLENDLKNDFVVRKNGSVFSIKRIVKDKTVWHKLVKFDKKGYNINLCGTQGQRLMMMNM
jgi:hypothetical protein